MKYDCSTLKRIYTYINVLEENSNIKCFHKSRRNIRVFILKFHNLKVNKCILRKYLKYKFLL